MDKNCLICENKEKKTNSLHLIKENKAPFDQVSMQSIKHIKEIKLNKFYRQVCSSIHLYLSPVQVCYLSIYR